MTKTLIFDFGNVLVPFDFSRCYSAMEKFCPFPGAEIHRRITHTGFMQQFESGQVSGKQFFCEVCRILELRVDYPKFCRLWNSIFASEPLIPESLLRGLHQRYRLLLLSNTNSIHFSKIQDSYSFIRHFDDYVLSYQVGALKPSLRIYRKAIARARCRAEECFYVDDIVAHVKAASRTGIDSVQFRSLGQLKKELRVRRIEWPCS